MRKVELLYKQFYIREKYKDIKEIKILSSLYEYSVDSLEVAISRIINEAVLNHMNLNIDSTIMQMLALNDYLSSLFIRNFEVLIYNYILNQLERREVIEIEDLQEEKISELSKEVDMKTDLSEIINEACIICNLPVIQEEV